MGARHFGRTLIGALAVLSVSTLTAEQPATRAEAVFAGGCFWAMEEALEKVPGVRSVVSGYTGGALKTPTYERVSLGGTGHVEAVRVTFDPSKVSYAQLVDVFWRNIDPLDRDGQFCDRGSQYRTAIFVEDDDQRRVAEESKRALDESRRFDRPLATEIRPAGTFYVAEPDHQDFYRKNPMRYREVEAACGRPRRLAEVWGKPR